MSWDVESNSNSVRDILDIIFSLDHVVQRQVDTHRGITLVMNVESGDVFQITGIANRIFHQIYSGASAREALSRLGLQGTEIEMKTRSFLNDLQQYNLLQRQSTSTEGAHEQA